MQIVMNWRLVAKGYATYPTLIIMPSFVNSVGRFPGWFAVLNCRGLKVEGFRV
jgi:hypothetical protein